jgi:hypothetical protein
MERKIVILADGKELPLVPFVEKLMVETISAMIGSLKGGEDAREIAISIRKKSD